MLRHLAKSKLYTLFKPKYYLSLCCIIKDENNYLQEWIQYHIKIGVQHFYIYDNGSRVPVKSTIKDLKLTSYTTVISLPGRSKQKAAYKHCLERYGYTSRWIGFIDTDEYIVPKTTQGDLQLFLKDYESVGGLGINWLIFGSSGHIKRAQQPQISTFLWRSTTAFKPNWHIKSIVQPKYVKHNVNPHAFYYVEGKFCVNENFVPIEDAFVEPSVDKIQLNHYYCRSLEEYREKIRRGRADNVSIARTDKDFQYHDMVSNQVKDTAILDILETM